MGWTASPLRPETSATARRAAPGINRRARRRAAAVCVRRQAWSYEVETETDKADLDLWLARRRGPCRYAFAIRQCGWQAASGKACHRARSCHPQTPEGWGREPAAAW